MEVESGGTSRMKEGRGTKLAGRSPAFLGRERATADEPLKWSKAKADELFAQAEQVGVM